ncbi:hypothetical protein C8F01DRAFT_1128025 [Mycena amicta]|nr:hypothetical protein C8F01DRAFT_1128025 [Mycena amicta]
MSTPPIDYARVIREATRSNLTALTDVLLVLETQLLEITLDSTRKQTIALRDECLALSAPARRLPSELLVEIFRYLQLDYVAHLWNKVDNPFSSSESSRDDIRALGRVCWRWSTIVNSTPTLWSTISVDLELWLDLPNALERSGTVPLDICIYFHPSASADRDELPILPLDMLLAHSEWWRNLSVIGPASLLHLQYLHSKQPEQSFPSLAGILLCGSASGTEFPLTILESSKLEMLALPANLYLQLVPDHALVLMSVGEEELGGVIGALERLPPHAQVSLHLHVLYFPCRSLPPTHSAINLLAIHSQDLLDPTESKALLGAIFTATLFITRSADSGGAVYWPQDSDSNAFLELATRSGFSNNLETLSLQGVFLSTDEIVQCLAALPRLASLTIADQLEERAEVTEYNAFVYRYWTQQVITDGLLRALTLEPSSDNKVELVPQLAELTLTLHSGDSVIDGFSLLALIRSRLKPERRFV